MRNEDTLLVHSTYGEGRDDGDGGSVFLLLRNGGETTEREVVLGHSPSPNAKEKGGRVSPTGGAKRMPDGEPWSDCLRTLE